MKASSASMAFGKPAVFSFLFFLLIVCSAKAQTSFTISGTIEKPVSDKVQLFIDPLHLPQKSESLIKELNAGQFQFNVPATSPSIVELVIEKTSQKLFVEPGDELSISLTAMGMTISGKGGEQNTFLKNFNQEFRGDFDDSVMIQKMLSMPIDPFEMMIFSNMKKQNEYLKKSAGLNFTKSFNEYLQNTVTYRYWNLLFAYPIINANSNKGLTVNGLPTVMLENFHLIKVNNDAALISEPYREFLKYYVIYFTSQANGFNKFTDFNVSAEKKLVLAKERLKGDAYTYWLARFTADESERVPPSMLRKLVSTLKESDLPNKYYPFVEKLCSTRMSMKEEKKADAPPATMQSGGSDQLDLVDVNGKHVSLDDFKGKVVYIDFWASWCGPCRMQMPFSRELHEKLTDKQKKQIVFLYISIDANLDAWKKGIQDNGIQGVNVISPGNWKSKVCSYFQINGIPRYMIMNKKGEIVEFNAKRPSDSSVIDDLVHYTQQ